MRILHTSDWHLGQTLHNFERGYEHQCFLDWLLDTLVSEEVDALLIAGDVFDNANPSAASQQQLYRFLSQAKARRPHLNVVLIAGNHDSAGRLEAPGPLLHALDIAVVGHIRRLDNGAIDVARLVLPLKNRAGVVSAWCLAIPFLRPGDVPQPDAEAVQAGTDSYAAGIALLYQQALQYALNQRAPGQAIVAMGHCHMVGADVSVDSERPIVIGGSEALSSSLFDPAIAYVALGHLHLAQAVGKQPHHRYSGSPLPMSFSEITYEHQVVCLDLDGENVKGIRPIQVPRAVAMLRVPNKPAAIDAVLAALGALDLPDVPDAAQPYLEVRVRLDTPEPGLRSKIEAALEGKAVRLAKIETTSNRATTTQAVALSLDEHERLLPEDIFERLYQQRFSCVAPAAQRADFRELLLEPTESPLP